MKKEKYIAHVDMDAFFAAIEERDNPQYRGKPIVVGSDPKLGRGRGVVSTCSYEARKYGIHSAMPISTAYRKCPHAVFLPVNMKKYADLSHKIYNIFYDFTPEIEPISIDEAFLDITGTYHLFGSPRKTCLLLKEKIKKETRLTASVGVAPIKMAAKIASDLKKPDGLVEVSQEGLFDFLWVLDIRKLWGLGKKTEIILREKGINTIGDIAKEDVKNFECIFGKNGRHLWELANGIDERSVEREKDAKSISNEITFEKDTLNKEMLESVLMSLCEKVSKRLREDSLKGRTVTLKIRLEGFHTYTRARTLDEPINFEDILYKEIKDLYNNFDEKGKKVRLLGVKVSTLSETQRRTSLFSEKQDKKREDIHKAIDDIKDRFGNQSIVRGKSFLSPKIII